MTLGIKVYNTQGHVYMYLLNARSWFEKGYYSIGLCSGTWYLTITSCSLRSLGGHQINHQISLILSNMILCCYYMYLSFILEKKTRVYTQLFFLEDKYSLKMAKTISSPLKVAR